MVYHSPSERTGGEQWYSCSPPLVTYKMKHLISFNQIIGILCKMFNGEEKMKFVEN